MPQTIGTRNGSAIEKHQKASSRSRPDPDDDLGRGARDREIVGIRRLLPLMAVAPVHRLPTQVADKTPPPVKSTAARPCRIRRGVTPARRAARVRRSVAGRGEAHERGGLRSGGRRRRSGRLRGGDQGSPARHEGGLRREARRPGRHLPQCRLHPVQGAAALLPSLRRGRPRHGQARRQGERRRARSADHAGEQEPGGEDPDPGDRVPLQEEQGGLCRRRRSARQSREGRRPAERQRRGQGTRHQEHPDRHRLRRDAAAWSDHRRGPDRLVDRRARSQARAQASPGRRRGLYRPRDGHGLATAGGEGDGGRVPRPGDARHGRRGVQGVREDPQEAGDGVQARHQGRGRGQLGRRDQGDGGSRPRAGPRRPSNAMSSWSRLVAAPTPRGSGSSRSASAWTIAPASRPMAIGAPTSTACGRSAT